ncbi:serine hydrolase [Dyadobacter sp. 3J3]|uniref:serine hydrolase domain-containing protein n=1 Tax=Dyadobacter sp. 3J3 TaxID=2606600 RepID=UPI001359D40D|nr:serine hydrolase domain-containing protein [Dyadobacter sp. 3J3]
MKLRILISILLLLPLWSCQDKKKLPNLLESIRSVERNLCKKGYESGDSLWNIQERMKFYGVPAVSIAVIRDNKIFWSRAYGILDKESKESASVHTLFQAGSISKPVAAYGALSEVLKGKINLDENVNTYLTSWKLPDNQFTKEKKVTLKHLLSHTGGITVHGFLGYSPDLPVPTLLQVLNGEPPANSPAIRVDKIPGKEWRYSGGGYTIMQQMLIDIEKKPFPAVMKSRVLDPLQMKNSTYDQPLPSDKLKLAATGYLPDGTMTKGKRHTYPEMAAAGLWTTSDDLARFAIDIQLTLQGEGSKVLSKTAAEQMLTPVLGTYGLGLDILKTGGDIYFQHGGWDEGFSSHLIAHKEKGYGVVVLTNSNHPDFISELIRSVALTEQWDNYLPNN